MWLCLLKDNLKDKAEHGSHQWFAFYNREACIYIQQFGFFFYLFCFLPFRLSLQDILCVGSSWVQITHFSLSTLMSRLWNDKLLLTKMIVKIDMSHYVWNNYNTKRYINNMMLKSSVWEGNQDVYMKSG